MPTKVIPDSQVEQMFRRGMTPTEVRDELARQGIDVSRAAITNWRSRRGMPSLRQRYSEFIPWDLLAAHRHRHPAKMLRLAGRRAAGGEVPPSLQADLDRWLDNLEANDMVVGYDPELPDGWFYHVRRPGVDDGLISNPEVPYA